MNIQVIKAIAPKFLMEYFKTTNSNKNSLTFNEAFKESIINNIDDGIVYIAPSESFKEYMNYIYRGLHNADRITENYLGIPPNALGKCLYNELIEIICIIDGQPEFISTTPIIRYDSLEESMDIIRLRITFRCHINKTIDEITEICNSMIIVMEDI